jgi:acetoacetyl-CoA synthetase
LRISSPISRQAVTFEPLPFAHPLYILFSSGTTGIPKCIVHSAGGTLLQHLKEHRLHCGVEPGERLFYFTTCGWMMWNWLVSGLAAGATLCLYDGSPFAPDGNVFSTMPRRNALLCSAPRPSSSTLSARPGWNQRTHDLSSLGC